MSFEHRAYVALGSNVGDRVAAIENACAKMESKGDLRIIQTSGLWETNPMYVEEQGKFLNGACEIETSLNPDDLLDRLQSIEKDLGRVKIVDKGPRNIDLDILLYDREVIHSDRLVVPHKLMLEREFVLRPLSQLIPAATLPDAAAALGASSSSTPGDSPTISDYLSQLVASNPPLTTVTPLSPNLPYLAPLLPTKKTHIMSILNLTPDSFSDGGQQLATNRDALASTMRMHLAAGATILDIGGQSTRPRAPAVSPTDELTRIQPALAYLPTLSASPTAISIDTFHAPVARASLATGAHIINDVSAGTLDPAMLPTIASAGCTAILMHMRGDPSTMSRLTDYPPGTESALVSTVAAELRARLYAAMRAGVRRWRVVLDPGLGFAKTPAQSIALLRRLPELRAAPGLEGLPWAVGVSRKGFVGRATGVAEPAERVWGTAAAVTAAVQGGADVVRVHDVKEMVEVVRMAEAIWRVEDGKGLE